MYEAGLISLFAALVLLIKLPRGLVRKLLWMDIPLDLTVTGFFLLALHGTYSGMMAAMVAGLAFSIVLFIAKKLFGYDRLVWRHRWPHWEPVVTKKIW